MKKLSIKRIRSYSLVLILLFTISCKKKEQQKATIRIAFLADVHLQDIYAGLQDSNYKGIPHPETGAHYTIRTMETQLKSTRLFNENYFAFLAALDDLVAKKINLVVLPGDFSDDGQPANIKALKNILNQYHKKNGMQFFLTTGNHDPVRPFSQEGGKYDFIGNEGQTQAIVSDSSLVLSSSNALPTIVTKEIKKWGYKELAHELSDFGFFPRKEFLYWETPYSKSDYANYNFQKIINEADIENRIYKIANSSMAIPDMSYLVEPINGVWILAIDANVYIPKTKSLNSDEFSGSSIGYNNVLLYKKHLIPWAKKIASEAKQKGKTLITFSHYPMVEFNDGATKEMNSLFGKNKMQAHRIPNDMVAEAFADAGIQIHLGGHMHLNDTGVFTSKKGNTLFNIQIPSLAAHTPAYKIVNIHSNSLIEIETPVLENVEDFNTLFALYRKEYDYLQRTSESEVWDSEILNSESYIDFTKKHLKQLVLSRLLNSDWPPLIKEQLITKTGKELLLSIEGTNIDSLQKDLVNLGLKLNDFENWNGLDMISDFYLLRSSDELSFKTIGSYKMKQYDFVCKKLMNSKKDEMKLWGSIFYKAYHGKPSVNFEIDLNTNTIRNLLN